MTRVWVKVSSVVIAFLVFHDAFLLFSRVYILLLDCDMTDYFE